MATFEDYYPAPVSGGGRPTGQFMNGMETSNFTAFVGAINSAYAYREVPQNIYQIFDINVDTVIDVLIEDGGSFFDLDGDIQSLDFSWNQDKADDITAAVDSVGTTTITIPSHGLLIGETLRLFARLSGALSDPSRVTCTVVDANTMTCSTAQLPVGWLDGGGGITAGVVAHFNGVIFDGRIAPSATANYKVSVGFDLTHVDRVIYDNS